MRTVTKQSLDVLARTMSVIPMSKLNGFVGGYSDDCFWRCIAYLNSGGSSYSESDAESYAYGYFSNLYGGYTSAYLTSLGAGMTVSQMLDYKSFTGSANYNSMAGKILVFNTDNVSCYNSTNTLHAVVLISNNSDGFYVFDPQLGKYCTISSCEIQHLTPW